MLALHYIGGSVCMIIDQAVTLWSCRKLSKNKTSTQTVSVPVEPQTQLPLKIQDSERTEYVAPVSLQCVPWVVFAGLHYWCIYRERKPGRSCHMCRLALFPGPTQLSVTFSMTGKLGGAWEQGYVLVAYKYHHSTKLGGAWEQGYVLIAYKYHHSTKLY